MAGWLAGLFSSEPPPLRAKVHVSAWCLRAGGERVDLGCVDFAGDAVVCIICLADARCLSPLSGSRRDEIFGL